MLRVFKRQLNKARKKMTVAEHKYLMAGAGNPGASDLCEGEADNYHWLLDVCLHSSLGTYCRPLIRQPTRLDRTFILA